MTGYTVCWNRERRFGKIHGDDHVEYFVHCDHLVDVPALLAGQPVAFEPVESARGPRATNVRPSRRGRWAQAGASMIALVVLCLALGLTASVVSVTT